MRVICYGDSNTYGYDPRILIGGRYGPESRWVDILAARTGWQVENHGVNGRTIPLTAPDFPPDTDLLIVFLGDNDLLQGASPQEAAGRLERFVEQAALPRERVLIVAPPLTQAGQWVTDPALLDASRDFARCCGETAARLGTRFADGSAWGVEMAYDGIHFTEAGHRAFAEGLLKSLGKG